MGIHGAGNSTKESLQMTNGKVAVAESERREIYTHDEFFNNDVPHYYFHMEAMQVPGTRQNGDIGTELTAEEYDALRERLKELRGLNSKAEEEEEENETQQADYVRQYRGIPEFDTDVRGINREMLAACQMLLNRNMGTTTPFEEFFSDLLLKCMALSDHEKLPTPDDVMEHFITFNRSWREMKEMSGAFTHAYREQGPPQIAPDESASFGLVAHDGSELTGRVTREVEMDREEFNAVEEFLLDRRRKSTPVPHVSLNGSNGAAQNGHVVNGRIA